MNTSFEDGKLTIQLPQRIDTSVAIQTGEELQTICQTTPHQQLILDASELSYIASSGLRILLNLAKTEPEMKITETSLEVYNVFQMTGFTRILNVTRALRTVSIEGCKEIGRGGVGIVYRLSDEQIIKVFRSGTPLSEVEKEMNLSKEAFVMGMPTAISFEAVKVGSQYGLVHELLNARTLAETICADPSKADHYGEMLGLLWRHNHQIEVTPGILPSAADVTLHTLEGLHRYFTDEQVNALVEIYKAIPQGNRILHCDLHPKNVMVVDGELILIDMGEVCYGNPLQDLGHSYSSMKGLVGDYQGIVGMSEEMAHHIYDCALRAYFGTSDPAFLARKERQIRIASLVRNFSWLGLSDSFSEDLIRGCQELIVERVMNHLDEIRAMLPELQEWDLTSL